MQIYISSRISFDLVNIICLQDCKILKIILLDLVKKIVCSQYKK